MTVVPPAGPPRVDAGDRGCGGVGELVGRRGGRGAAGGSHRDVDRAGRARRGAGRELVPQVTVTEVPAVAPKSTVVAPVSEAGPGDRDRGPAGGPDEG